MEIAVLGPAGTFSCQAYDLLSKLLNRPMAMVETGDNLSTILAIVNHDAQYALVPVANNVTGAVSETLGFLAQMAYPNNGTSGHPFSVVGEIAVTVNHSLIGWRGDDLASIQRVFSHPQGLTQCYLWIASNLPAAKLVTRSSTAGSIAEVTGTGNAAIAKPDNLNENQVVLAENIQPEGNATRFLVVAQRGLGLPIEMKVSKASFVVGISDEPGALLGALEPLATCQLTEIFSIPKPGDQTRKERIFWLDLDYTDEVNLGQLKHNVLVRAADRLIDLGAYGSLNERPSKAEHNQAWTLAE